MTKSGIPALLVAFGLTALGTLVQTHAVTKTRFDLVSTNVNCLPDARGTVTVFHREELRGVDTLRLHVSGLPAKTGFAVFLTEGDAFTAPPFGAVSYIGDLTTDNEGVGSLRVDSIVAEAFLSARQGDPPVRVRFDTDRLVMWFADPAEVPACFNFNGATPFDGDGVAGPAALSTDGVTGLEIVP